MTKRLKIILFLTVIFYFIGITVGLIMREVNLINLIRYPNLERIMFLIFNLYIIFCFIAIILKKRKSNHINKKFFVITSIGYIVLQTFNLAMNIYKTLVLYNFDSKDSMRLISSSLINPNGFIPNVIIVLILLILYMMPGDKQ